MTMLDRMRQHRNWLKWSLAIVCVAMVIFFIPNFVSDPSGNLAASGAVAVVEGREIRGDEFQRTYQAQIQAYRSAYGANMSDLAHFTHYTGGKGGASGPLNAADVGTLTLTPAR